MNNTFNDIQTTRSVWVVSAFPLTAVVDKNQNNELKDTTVCVNYKQLLASDTVFSATLITGYHKDVDCIIFSKRGGADVRALEKRK